MNQDYIQQLIANGKTTEAIEALRTIVKENPSLMEELILVEAQYHEYRSKKNTNTERSDNLEVTKNRIDKSLLGICKRAFKKQSSSVESPQQPSLSSREISFAVQYTLKDILRQPGKHIWIWALIVLILASLLDVPTYMDQVTYPMLNKWPAAKPFFLLACLSGTLALIFIDIQKLLRSYRNRPHLTTKANSPIKGLLSFDFEDAAIFKELQRGDDIELCLSGILSDEFRLGILSGESGSGKTSLIRAGLYDALAQKELLCIVAKLTNEAPILSIQKAIHQQLPNIQIPEDCQNLFDLLQVVISQSSKSNLILVLDQFEQFFTHQKTAEKRASFIRQLKQCYTDLPEAKLLISLRRDFTGRLYEIQEVLLYHLLPRQNYFDLKKFTAEQAAAIFEVMALAEEINYDQDFVQQMCSEELVSPEDGLISAVDIQILGFIIKGQQSSQRAFTRKAFQSMGGIDGLMQRFLQEHLDTPNYYNTDQNALKVLLAFIDIENQVSAGELSQQQLLQKLASPQITPHLIPILSWLEELRLITRNVAPNKPDTYELSHERLILPITSLAGRSLGEVEQANQILNKRTNEWLANEQKSRFLLSWGEYQKIREQKKRQLIRWGKNRQVKEKMLQATGRKFAVRFTAIALSLLLAFGWWGFRQTNWYMFNIEVPTELESLVVEYLDIEEQQKILEPLVPIDLAYSYHLIEQINDNETRDDAFLQFVRAGTDSTLIDSVRAIQKEIIDAADKIEDARDKSEALLYIAQTIFQIGDTTQAVKYINHALKITDQIEYSFYKPRILNYISQVTALIGYPEQAKEYLHRATVSIIRRINENTYYKSEDILNISKNAVQIDDTLTLNQINAAINQIKNPYKKSRALFNISKTVAQRKDTIQAKAYLLQALFSAKDIPDYINTNLVIDSISEAAVQFKDSQVLQHALSVVEEIEYMRYKVLALKVISYATAKLKDTSTLTQTISVAKQIDHAYFKPYILSHISQAFTQMSDTMKATFYLKKALLATINVEDASAKSYALSDISQAAAKYGDTLQARTYLQQALTAAKKIIDISSRSAALQYSIYVGNELVNSSFLIQVISAFDTIEQASLNWDALKSIAQAAAQIGDTQTLQMSIVLAKKIKNASDKSNALRSIAQAAAQLENRQLLEDIAQTIPRISGLEYQSVVQEALVAAWLQLGEYRKAYHMANNISLSNAKLKALAFLNLMKAHKEGEAFEPVVIEEW